MLGFFRDNKVNPNEDLPIHGDNQEQIQDDLEASQSNAIIVSQSELEFAQNLGKEELESIIDIQTFDVLFE